MAEGDLRARLQGVIQQMQLASDAVDTAYGTSDHNAALVALALVARHFLREYANLIGEAPQQRGKTVRAMTDRSALAGLVARAERWLKAQAGATAIPERADTLIRDLLDALRDAGRGEECEVCREKGIAPSRAIACALHSTHAIRELEAENAVLRDAAGAGSRLHLALAKMDECVPSADGEAELASVREARARMDAVRQMLEQVLAVANDDAPAPRVADPPRPGET